MHIDNVAYRPCPSCLDTPPHRPASVTPRRDGFFCLEALVPYLADLKQQIALRQAMP